MNLVVQLSFLMLRHFKDFPQPCSWGICWAFGSSQGLIWKITPFKRSIGIIPRINTQPHSKIVLSLFEIFSSSKHKYFQGGFLKTFPEQILFSILSFFVDIPQKAVCIYRTVSVLRFLSIILANLWLFRLPVYVAVHLLPNLFWVQQSALLKDQNSSAASSLSCMVLILDSL